MDGRPSFERILAFDVIVNFRDYGGYAVAGGGAVRTGSLYRSGQHWEASTADLDRVAGIGFDVVFDLRGATERAKAPCPRPTTFGAEVITVPGETTGALAPHLAAAEGATSPEQAFRAMVTVYRGMVGRPILQQALSLYFERLARPCGPSLIHCHSGKDRTGMAVALLHRVLGVHADDIMADYLLTNTTSRIEERLNTTDMSARFGNLSEAAARRIMTVDPAYLNAAYDEMAQIGGSIEGYMDKVLGVDEERIEALRRLWID